MSDIKKKVLELGKRIDKLEEIEKDNISLNGIEEIAKHRINYIKSQKGLGKKLKENYIFAIDLILKDLKQHISLKRKILKEMVIK